MIIYNFFKKNKISTLLKNIAIEHNSNEIMRLSNILVVYLLSPMMLIGSLISFFLFLWWNEPIWMSLMKSSIHFLIGLGMICAIHSNRDEDKKRRIIGWFLILSNCITYLFYYSKIGNLYWISLILIMLPATLNSSKSFFYQIVLFIAPAITFSYYFQSPFISIDGSYYIVLSIIMFFTIMVIFVINRIFAYVMREKSIQFKIINEQKEILLTSEEELRAHNEMLNESNAALEEKQELLEHLAYTDTLTGLENRKKIKEKIDDLILLNRQHNKVFTLVFIDLNEFKKINNIAGHGIGDKFLIKTADKIRAHVDNEDLVFRIGGDEFAIIINREISDENLLIYLRYLMHSIKSPVLIDNHQLYVNASCSVARWPLDGATCSELLIAADTAMHEVKNTKGNDIYFFNKALRSKKLNRIELEYELIKALKNDEFLLHYQPLMRAHDKKILGFEALIRWQSPKYGFVSPIKFIPVAEEIGLIYEVGKWVIMEVCNMLNRLGDKATNYSVAINVSSIQLKNPHFLSDIEDILSKTNVNPRRLKFELTESVLIDDVDKVTDIINDLRRIGISIAIDDFGTGFSSLSYLLNIPIDILKIDRSFIDRILTSRKKRGLINSIIDMAHNLDMSVIAEGVETEKQADYLTNQHCDVLQGYYFSKPVDERTLFEMIEKQK